MTGTKYEFSTPFSQILVSFGGYSEIWVLFDKSISALAQTIATSPHILGWNVWDRRVNGKGEQGPTSLVTGLGPKAQSGELGEALLGREESPFF